jgi:serine/threonine-protein kinase
MKPGEVIQGKYRLDQRLGVGGMGEVWRATHTGTGREFAVKSAPLAT